MLLASRSHASWLSASRLPLPTEGAGTKKCDQSPSPNKGKGLKDAMNSHDLMRMRPV